MSIIFVIWAIKKVVKHDLHKIHEPSTNKKLVQYEFIFLFGIVAAILFMYATFYISKLDYTKSIRILMHILWFYLLVRCFSIEERFSKQLLLLGIIFMLFFEAVVFDWLNFLRYGKSYSSMQEMEQDLGDTFLFPTGTWDNYPQDGSNRYEAFYDRLPPLPLINYKPGDSTNISNCVLIKGTYDGVIKIIIVPSDTPNEEIYYTNIENMSACSDRKGNRYYSGGLDSRSRIAFEYQDYLYVIDVEQRSGSIADEMYYDMRYGMQY